MEKHIPVIVKFISSIKVYNPKGGCLKIKKRETSVLIIVLSGKIRFTQNGNSTIASPKSPIYIPKGASYLNECLEDAESLLLNFEECRQSDAIAPLAYIEPQKAIRIFERVLILHAQKTLRAEAEIFSLFYSLVSEGYTESVTAERSLIAPALEYIELHLSEAELTVERLAACCCISSVYLRKLFQKELGMSPFSYVTCRRMETAREMLYERCSVGETALRVGYGDIYQFSRAFKKYYGVSPKHFCGG